MNSLFEPREALTRDETPMILASHLTYPEAYYRMARRNTSFLPYPEDLFTRFYPPDVTIPLAEAYQRFAEGEADILNQSLPPEAENVVRLPVTPHPSDWWRRILYPVNEHLERIAAGLDGFFGYAYATRVGNAYAPSLIVSYLATAEELVLLQAQGVPRIIYSPEKKRVSPPHDGIMKDGEWYTPREKRSPRGLSWDWQGDVCRTSSMLARALGLTLTIHPPHTHPGFLHHQSLAQRATTREEALREARLAERIRKRYETLETLCARG